MNSHMPYWLAATFLPVGPRTFARWLAEFTDIRALFFASEDELLGKGIPAKFIAAIKSPDWRQIETELAWVEQANCHLICLDDAHYPKLLKETADPPLLLYVKGNVSALANSQIAIVGSRSPTIVGIKNATQFAEHLAAAGFAITSGLALGIDGASHEGALSVGGTTLAICGTGLNHCYPTSHRSLAAKILQQGALVSEFPLATTAHKLNFPRRNRIIAGLSVGTLVIEAALKSGSLITARHALECGREVFAVPGSIHHPLAKGCHHLIRQGAKLVETAQHIFEEIAPLCVAANDKYTEKKAKIPDNLAVEGRRVLGLINHEITPMDVILLRSGLTAGEVCSILLRLELDGFVQPVQGGYVRKV